METLFDKYKVDLALQGHDHTYTRGRVQPYETNIVDGENVKDRQGQYMLFQLVEEKCIELKLIGMNTKEIAEH